MECENCRYNYQSYHCMGCSSYDGDLEDLETFCYYCNYNRGSDACGNCVWEEFS